MIDSCFVPDFLLGNIINISNLIVVVKKGLFRSSRAFFGVKSRLRARVCALARVLINRFKFIIDNIIFIMLLLSILFWSYPHRQKFVMKENIDGKDRTQL